MVKKGDTLIEVTLAIGIFSLVAIAVVSVVSSSSTGAQTALETTLAREEIDTQAEALRFIQSSYASGGAAGNPYQAIWEAITNYSVSSDNTPSNPATCSDLYDTKEDATASIFNTKNHAFVINTRKLGSSTDPNDIVVKSYEQYKPNSKFTESSTYPRVIYTATEYSDQPDESIIGNNTNNNLFRAEGIYVTAVPGPETVIVKQNSTRPQNVTAAYYDFYIRTCWYGSGSSTPTTISTVIRLYDPAAFQD